MTTPCLVGPYVVVSTHVLRKATQLGPHPADVLFLAPPEKDRGKVTLAARFDTPEAAHAAITRTVEWAVSRGYDWPADDYEVVPLAVWEEEQLSSGRRRQRAARAKDVEA